MGEDARRRFGTKRTDSPWLEKFDIDPDSLDTGTMSIPGEAGISSLFRIL